MAARVNDPDRTSRNRRMDAAMEKEARKADVPDGGTYEYPSRASDSSISLSVVVVIFVVALLAAVAYVMLR